MSHGMFANVVCLHMSSNRDNKGQKKVGIIVVCMEECFDIIHEAHCLRGRLGVEQAWTTLSPKYFNITQKMVRAYWATCHICTEKSHHYRIQEGKKLYYCTPGAIISKWTLLTCKNSPRRICMALQCIGS